MTKISEKEFIKGHEGSWKCRDCGEEVSHYTCNADLIAKRPEAADWDWWSACDNENCPNHQGEGIFQDRPDWELKVKG